MPVPRLLPDRRRGDRHGSCPRPPTRHRSIIAYASEHSLTIEHVLLTNLHADFVTGHLDLRDRAGATVYLGAAANASYAFTPLRDGEILEVGRVRLETLDTPGHSKSISIVVYDLDASYARPHAVLTGDTLFIGDVGRPDMRVARWATRCYGIDSARHPLYGGTLC